jgi:hypothetical protein
MDDILILEGNGLLDEDGDCLLTSGLLPLLSARAAGGSADTGDCVIIIVCLLVRVSIFKPPPDLSWDLKFWGLVELSSSIDPMLATLSSATRVEG